MRSFEFRSVEIVHSRVVEDHMGNAEYKTQSESETSKKYVLVVLSVHVCTRFLLLKLVLWPLTLKNVVSQIQSSNSEQWHPSPTVQLYPLSFVQPPA